MKVHDLLQRDGHHYTYRLTDKGVTLEYFRLRYLR
jgi:hypothetical protein